MIKKLIVVMALAFTLAMAQPVGEARAATNTAVAVQAQQAAQAALMVQIQDELDQLRLAEPAGFWGWAQCLGAVAAVVGGSAIVAAKVAVLVKKAGSIMKVIAKAKTRIDRLPKAKRLGEYGQVLRTIGLEVLGVTAIYYACFN